MSTAILDGQVHGDVSHAGHLELAPSGLSLHTVAPDRVSVEIVLRNAGDGCSGPTRLPIAAAPLGAFVPWRPLTTLHVPALEPGESYRAHAEVLRVAAEPLGQVSRIRPQQVVEAAFGNAAVNRPVAAALLLGRLLARHPRHVRSHAEAIASGVSELPADLFDLIGRHNPHWAGNLNVFIGDRAVERHLARSLRIYPGRLNVAMFVVGSGADSYAFHLEGDGAHWGASLYDARTNESLVDLCDQKAIATGEWVAVTGTGLMLLAIRPSDVTRAGSVDVVVRQKSTRRQARVEFSLDATASGPGCYVV